jgi:hypothetical protein
MKEQQLGFGFESEPEIVETMIEEKNYGLMTELFLANQGNV